MWTNAELLYNIPKNDVANKYAFEKVKRLCIDFSIALLDHRLSGSEFDSVIVSFIAIAGLDSKKKRSKK